MRLQSKSIPLFAIGLIIQLSVYAQIPTGQSSNLCPRETFRYTSASSDVNQGSCGTLGWICSGCVDNEGKATSSVIASGLNSNGTFWADVKWGNVASGSIATVCGSLDVQIDVISQASIVEPSTILLCGSSSLTIQASVASQANIVGFKWQISGTGVSPTGTIETTDPELTISFTNWNPSSSQSATVAVAARSACGFSTDIGPLSPISFPGLPTIPAIPRSAWVQLSPGNINNLLVPLSFSSPVICTTGTISVTNQPTNTSLTWSSNNTSALTVGSSTGDIERVNNFNGTVSVSATLSNACGSHTHSTNVWLGKPGIPLVSGLTLVGVGTYNYYEAVPWNGDPTFADQGIASNGYEWSFPFTQTNAGWSCSPSYLSSTLAFSGSQSTYLGLRTINACGYSVRKDYEIFVEQENCPPGGCEEPFFVYPNPSSNELSVSSKDQSGAAKISSISLIDSNGITVFLENVKSTEKVEIPVKELKNGIYYLSVTEKSGKTRKRQIVIKH